MELNGKSMWHHTINQLPNENDWLGVSLGLHPHPIPKQGRHSMAKKVSKKKLLVVCDNPEIAKAITAILGEQLEISALVLQPEAPIINLDTAFEFNLIVIALSEYASEPVVALARASLGYALCQIPLLIISDKFFESHVGTKIIHLDFPFTASQLEIRVDEILNGKLLNPPPLRRVEASRAPDAKTNVTPIQNNP